MLFDNFYDAACARFDQHCATIYDGVAMLAYAILRRNVIIGHALFWKNSSYSHIFSVLIRWTPLFNDV